jgi:hypothetical protein
MIDQFPANQMGARSLGTLSAPRDQQAEARRAECLDMAIRSMAGSGGDVVKLAGQFYDFVTGKSAAERVIAAVEKANL